MKRLVILLSVIIGLASCDNLLDVDPTTQYSIETFWEGGLENYKAALAGCYNSLYDAALFFDGELEMITPNAIAYNSANGTREIALGIALETTSFFQYGWNRSYEGIGRANTFLDNIESATFDESTKQQMKGEALFLRALYYSYLIDLYGACPLILSTPSDNQGDLPRTEKSVVLKQVLDDLDSAAVLLPKTYGSSTDIGRVTKGAALALKARTLLYNERWSEAATAAREVIDLDIYDLFPDYRGLYLPANENNEEIIFDVQYESPDFVHRHDYVSLNLNRPAPLKDLVDAYLMKDGKTIHESALYNSDTPFENRDPRLLQTIACIGYPFNGITMNTSYLYESGFGLKKLTAYTDNETQTINDNSSDLNFIVIRYAEVLLTYAEALNELSVNPDEEVYWAINKIRGRATVEMPEVEEGLSKEEMRNVIRLERRIELAGEGLYYADIRRWKTIEIQNNGPVYNYNGDIIETRAFDPERDYLWAVPSSEITENENLEQNPNW